MVHMSMVSKALAEPVVRARVRTITRMAKRPDTIETTLLAIELLRRIPRGRKISASDLAKLRAQAFADFFGLQAAWTAELQEASGAQNFLNAVQNYPLLKGVQTNLYKCFMPLAWGLNSAQGVTGLLHPEGPYDDPKGGALREAVVDLRYLPFLWLVAAAVANERGRRTTFGGLAVIVAVWT